jgi:hypothetical protein
MGPTTTFALRRRLPTAAIVVATVVALLATAGASSAQEAGIDRTAAARALFEEGLALLDAERWEDAADRFQRALALRPSPQITYNLTTALIPLGRLVRASELLRQVSLDPTASSEVRQAAEARRAQIVPRIASLIIVAPGDLATAEVTVDERPLDAVLVGVAVPVDPGRHVVTARRRGVELVRRDIVLLDGEDVEVDLGQPLEGEAPDGGLEAGLDGDSSPAGAGERGGRRSSNIARQWWFWTIIGAVVVGGAVTAGVLASQSGEQWEDPVPGPPTTFVIDGEP